MQAEVVPRETTVAPLALAESHKLWTCPRSLLGTNYRVGVSPVGSMAPRGPQTDKAKLSQPMGKISARVSGSFRTRQITKSLTDPYARAVT